ncbi:MAG TPA: tRNA (adenosine(37)-N6)-threonylcarbamoyltransferase complex dimerization subunit type 1 TsaB, partial [Solirubrobacteraceae bacterium]|nr:tRNA (adenosine(37)-N6)-threonylcarbamoyltransferase complex dimerization subunit type 1 TsaB [Solirubrobacteraceae bacterium]
MNLLAFDTATPATVVGAVRGERHAERRHDPLSGERPGHATRLLGLVDEALAEVELELGDLDRLGVGVGPGSFTGLRIGIATARALAQSAGVPLAGVSTLAALAAGAADEGGPQRAVLAVIDAGRGEGFAAAFRDARPLAKPAALAPAALADLAATLEAPLAVGGGAVRFRAQLRAAGAAVPADESPLHRLDGRQLSRLAAAAETADRDTVLPHYTRA